MKNNIELDSILSSIEVNTLNLQGLLHALDCSVDEFIDPISHKNDTASQQIAISMLLNERQTVLALIQAIKTTVKQQQEQLNKTTEIMENDINGKY